MDDFDNIDFEPTHEELEELDGYDETDEPWDGFRDDVDADADALASAGFGTDEDYDDYYDDYDDYEGYL